MFRKVLGMLLTLVVLDLSSQAQERPTGTATVASKDGEVLYRQHCASCHEAGVPRAADRAALGRMSPENIRLALTSGSMRAQGAHLTPAQ
jgi:polyvinyl alcohol dehydrogenase (cytochrome)